MKRNCCSNNFNEPIFYKISYVRLWENIFDLCIDLSNTWDHLKNSRGSFVVQY